MSSIYGLLLGIFLLVVPQLSAEQTEKRFLKNPHEIDLGELDVDFELQKARDSTTDCPTYYRRLVKHLFNSERFQHDPGSDRYIANVPLRLTKEQWELLVDIGIDGLNLNEVDNLLQEVAKQSNENNWAYPVAQILFEHYRHQLIESLPSINSPGVMVLVGLLTILAANRFFNFSKLTYSALILFVLLIIVVVSYGMSYWDCISDLEVERMIQLSKKTSRNNPCKDYDGEHESFWSSVRAIIAGSSENKCLEHMRSTFKTAKRYCDPLDVLARWAGKIQMGYFSSVFGGFFELITDFTSSSNILSKAVFWVISIAAFVFLILHFGKAVINVLFKGFFLVLTTSKVKPDEPIPGYSSLSSKMDEILHENRLMKRELAIIRESSVERSLPSAPVPLQLENNSKLQNIDEEQ